MSYVPSGTPTGPQVGGDCKRVACDGAGNVVTIADDADLPNDGNACTSDVCSGGTPGFPAAAAGTSCGAGRICNGSGGCGVCLPNDTRYCCGVKTPACCLTSPPEPSEAPAKGALGASPSAPIACCCGGDQYCDNSGNWGSCNQ